LDNFVKALKRGGQHVGDYHWKFFNDALQIFVDRVPASQMSLDWLLDATNGALDSIDKKLSTGSPIPDGISTMADRRITALEHEVNSRGETGEPYRAALEAAKKRRDQQRTGGAAPVRAEQDHSGSKSDSATRPSLEAAKRKVIMAMVELAQNKKGGAKNYDRAIADLKLALENTPPGPARTEAERVLAEALEAGDSTQPPAGPAVAPRKGPQSEIPVVKSGATGAADKSAGSDPEQIEPFKKPRR
jgi:hypothetical protein